MGVSDLPAVIDYILEKTGAQQIFYIGHSMGTTMFYVLGSERPEYNSKIRAMFSLAPVAFMSHLKSPVIQLTAQVSDELEVKCQCNTKVNLTTLL
jgi:lysosomal acid lipase/cholesteryl ester hydrolase